MTTIIDNNQKVFLIERIGISQKFFFCNLESIPKCLEDLEKKDEFTIKVFYNSKFKKVSKKTINQMFKSNQINYEI